MAYRAKFMRVSFGGTLTNTDEIWSSSFHIADATRPDGMDYFSSVVTSADYDAIAAEITSMVDNVYMRIPSDYVLQWVKFAYIDTNGLYWREPYEVVGINQQGGNTGAYAPQLSLVVSFDSGKFKDPGKWNRFYLPTVALQEGSEGYLSTAFTSQASLAAQATFEAINTILWNVSAGTVVSVVSNADEGYDDFAAYVRVGNVLDTQRRRRNQLNETYSTNQISYPQT